MSDIQIVIPMSGFGERFRQAGYRIPKPLIEVEGKPIIGHVIEMFPGEQDFLFVCNEDHLAHPDYGMEAAIRAHCARARIVGIPPHKRGPVHAVQQVLDRLDPQRPVFLSYCDYTCYWDWHDFRAFVARTGCDGAIPAYRGFHPHTLGHTYYAYMREEDGWLTDIQEKAAFTDDRMNEYASSGGYYFATAALMAEAFERMVAADLNYGGEYYASLAYKPLLDDGRAIAVYELQHFMQWGTPQDVAEYRQWSAVFKQLAAPQPAPAAAQGSIVMPMAGLGQRFAVEGYALTKPLIPVSGRPMVMQAMAHLPPSQAQSFVLRADMPGCADIRAALARAHPAARIVTIPQVTEGQACTALIGLDALAAGDGAVPGPVTVGACDCGVIYDPRRLQALLDDESVDVIVWSARGHADAIRRPQMWGWLHENAGRIDGVSVKKAPAAPATDPVFTGVFTFRRERDLRAAIAALRARDGRVNGEFYLDSCIEDCLALGLECRSFEVDALLPWGTPNELRTFEYWQSCFHKWDAHPYRLELDPRVDPAGLPALRERYAARTPARPAALLSPADPA
jgi:NDP-sugar pyrophosphorylase family protein